MGRLAGALGLAGVALAVALGIGELAVRLVLPGPTHYRVYSPDLRVTLEPHAEIMPGISGPSRFFVNSLGMRGDEPPEDDAYRILAAGGSTTQCLYLDQDEAWPARLQVLLDAGPGPPVWVANVGKAGRYSSDHVLQVRELLDGFDALVMLLGANDAYRRLRNDVYQPRDPDDPEDRAYLLPRAFDLFPRDYALLPPSRTALWALLDRSRQLLRTRANWRNVEDQAGLSYQAWREHRAQAARLRDTLPDLSDSLNEYVANLRLLTEHARRSGVRVLFLTQPTIYRADLPEEERALLWMGRVGPLGELGANDYYTVEALAEAFALYNETLLGFCREARVDCMDLAAALPKDTRSFYDDVHFNESGSERVAREVYAWFAELPVFREP